MAYLFLSKVTLTGHVSEKEKAVFEFEAGKVYSPLAANYPVLRELQKEGKVGFIGGIGVRLSAGPVFYFCPERLATPEEAKQAQMAPDGLPLGMNDTSTMTEEDCRWSLKTAKGPISWATEGHAAKASWEVFCGPTSMGTFVGWADDAIKWANQVRKEWFASHIAELTLGFQGWKTVALLKGLGFGHKRTAEGDVIKSFGDLPSGGTNAFQKVFEGWEPSKDGSRLTNWEDLNDPGSPHYGRRYLVAYRYDTGRWREQKAHRSTVLVFETSPHGDEPPSRLVAVGDYGFWLQCVQDQPETYGLNHWLAHEGVSL